MRYFLGFDVGATKTHALLADENGQALGFGVGGPGNHQSVSYAGLQAVLQAVSMQALSMAGVSTEAIAGAGFGIAGYDWPSQREDHLRVCRSIGLACPMDVTNDSVIGLMAGASQGWGVGMVAGTSNNCRGRDRDGREGRITGEGTQFGEYGGASELVMKAVHAVSYQWTRRGPETLLSTIFIEMTGARDLNDLIEGIDLERYQPDATWAISVFDAAHRGDQVAGEIIAWSGREMAESACAVIRQLHVQDEAFEVIMAGRFFEGGHLYIDPLKETILKLAPRASFVRLTVPPVVGGVVLGVGAAGMDARTMRGNLISSTEELLRSVHD
jgi:N-acetylglucosamine kinase-like BadF-type ATPase